MEKVWTFENGKGYLVAKKNVSNELKKDIKQTIAYLQNLIEECNNHNDLVIYNNTLSHLKRAIE